MPLEYTKIITVEPGKRGGKPCIRGLRITVYDILEYLASGMSDDEILADFPDLTQEDVRACLAFALNESVDWCRCPLHEVSARSKHVSAAQRRLNLNTFLPLRRGLGLRQRARVHEGAARSKLASAPH